MSEENNKEFETIVVHPVTGEKESFTGKTMEEVNQQIVERFGE